MTPNIKLTYFNVKALAEPTRMLLKYGGIDFVDSRVERYGSAWDELKKSEWSCLLLDPENIFFY